MKHKPEVEGHGIEHIPETERHGRVGRSFTLWLAGNLTIADYVLGVLTVLVFGLTLAQAIPILIIGNVLGGTLLALSAMMGPKTGYPQMMVSRASFGTKGNYPFGAFNWISTVGWFTVNVILGAEAVQAIYPAANFVGTMALLIAAQALIAIYGHDLIHQFERAMAVVLGLLFLAIFALALPRMGEALAFVPSGGSATFPPLAAVGITLAASFSYIMSWSPYASDYSRYLPSTSSRKRVFLMTLLGGAIASTFIEVIGAVVGSLTGSLSYFDALKAFAGSFGLLAIAAVVLGSVSANVLNIYTNALSALVLDVKIRRWAAVAVGGAVGFGLAIYGGANFEGFFENFLLLLDYWITPWLAIVLVDFISGRATAESVEARRFDGRALIVYAVALACSVPFMVPLIALPLPFGALSYLFGGADYSYFVSFAIAGALRVWLK